MSALAARIAEPSTPAVAPIQCKARLGPVDDPLEHEADRAADAVMRGESFGISAAAPARPQATCAACEEDDKTVQRKCAQCGAGHAGGGEVAGGAAQAARAVAADGAPLPAAARAYFEPRFGRDLSGVRVHTDAASSAAADAIGARAYTLGSAIAFAQGEFAPAAPAGQRLLAHELAHVVQQGAEPTVRRTPNASSSCTANVHGAPADPIAELAADDARAQTLALGASNVLALEALTFADPTFGRSYVSEAYERRFGLPPSAAGGRFRNRFAGTLHATQDIAMAGEMMALSDRYRVLSTFLAGPIRYRCPGTSPITLPGCAAGLCGGSLAMSCPGGNQIAVCPSFWTFPLMQSLEQRGGNMIHEAVHMRLGFRPHALGTVDQRGRNPECYAAFLGDIYGFQSDDTGDCVGLIP